MVGSNFKLPTLKKSRIQDTVGGWTSAGYMLYSLRDMETVGTSKGKIILAGEHSVVYGHAALAFPSSLSTEVEATGDKATDFPPAILSIIHCISSQYPDLEIPKTIRIIESVPQNAGLGSSAALSHAIIDAVSKYNDVELSSQEKFALVQECERVFHSTPSGIDAATVVYEKPLKLKSKDNQPIIEMLPSGVELPPYILIDSGTAQESTREMVAQVKLNPKKDKIFLQMAAITGEIEQGLLSGDLDLRLIIESERLLEQLGIVGEKARKIISILEKNGAVAKIVGAGGRIAGSGTILAFHGDLDQLKRIIENEGLDVY